MKRLYKAAIGILVTLGIVWVARTLFPSDEQRIRSQLHRLAEASSTDGTEDHLARMAAARRVGTFFASDVMIDFGGMAPSITGRDTVVALVFTAREPGRQIAVDLVDSQVAIAPDRESALVSATARVRSIDSRTREEVVEAREVEVSFRNVEGDWLITRARLVKAVETP